MTNEDIIDAIIKMEGGFVNDPSDPGGATNYGITIGTLAEWRGRPVSVEDVKALTKEEARQIYIKNYVTSRRFDEILDLHLRALVVDCGVNHGPGTAIRWLQAESGAKVDGVVGQETLEKTNSSNPKLLIHGIIKRRVEFYAKIVQQSPTQAKFLVGWMRRAMEFLPPPV